jgi:hypothetical protein
MSCGYCGSKNEETFEAELSLCFPRIENLPQRPIYLCQRTRICLDCGHTDLKVPADELQRLKPGSSSITGPNQSVPDDTPSS